MTPHANADVERASEEQLQRGRWRLTAWALLIAVVVVLVDQGTKAWAEAALTEHERIPLVGDLLGLQLAYNPGAAFSFGEGSTWVFALIAVAATVTALVFAFRVRRPGWAIIIGALGGPPLRTQATGSSVPRDSRGGTSWTSSPTATGSSGTSPTS